jgi:hypothetical protein
MKKCESSAMSQRAASSLFILTVMVLGTAACKTKCPPGTLRMNERCLSTTGSAGEGTPGDAAGGAMTDVVGGDTGGTASKIKAVQTSSGSNAASGLVGAAGEPGAAGTVGAMQVVASVTAVAGNAAADPAAPVCGDGVVDSDELCDGNCPTACDPPNGCQLSTLVGDAATCTASCEASEVTECMPDDGCCAAGCKYPEDTDCSKSCGDGVVDAPEICEATSPDQPCPTSCDDGDPCTTDKLSGSAEECNAMCSSTPVTRPTSGDECCPPGANAANDDDCETKCGDGVVTGSETCDPASNKPCPSSCDDGDRCTMDMLVGSAAQCNAMCANTGSRETAERCDGRDNDCNGMVDDGVANACGGCTRLSAMPQTPCSEGMGACMNMGRYECSGKEAVKCSAREGRSSEEVCGDNTDNDCDGDTDECPSGQSCVPSGSRMACSLPLPTGSYRNSCEGCVYDGSTLTCEKCENGTGGARSSSLRGSCGGGQIIANCYGTLGCRDPVSAVIQQGTYDASCTGCNYDECQLHCTSCGDGTGQFFDTTTQDFPCPSGIENCFGRLQCGAC